MDKKDRPYAIVPYTADWPHMFQEEKKEILSIVQLDTIKIYHVGSTAIPGMWAKPQIDIMITSADLAMVDQYIPSLETLGYVFDPNMFIKDCKYFFKDAKNGMRLATIQWYKTNDPQAQSKYCFREYLRAHKNECERYAQVKRDAFDGGRSNRLEYAEKKAKEVERLLQKSKEWCQNGGLSDCLAV